MGLFKYHLDVLQGHSKITVLPINGRHATSKYRIKDFRGREYIKSTKNCGINADWTVTCSISNSQINSC